MNDTRDTKARAFPCPWWSGVDLLLRSKDGDGKKVNGRVVWEEVKEENFEPHPTVKMTNDAAQALMDDLWVCGIRPTAGAGSAGAMQAAQSHIADLRAIAFKSLGIEKA
jgi:hypothetical protein